MTPKAQNSSGFTLIELAIVLVASGLLMAGLIGAVKPYVENSQIKSTQNNLDIISKALASYALTYNRLPCPASSTGGPEPYGSPVNSGVDGTDIINDCNGIANNVGIVPFRALGLNEEQVKDAWGNLITYAVTPVLAGFGGAFVSIVQEQCRTRVWLDDTVTQINPEKARFCCPRYLPPGQHIVINDSNVGGNPVFISNYAPGFDDTENAWMGPTEPTPGGETIAFVLVSHGKNGDGAYVRNGAPRVVTAVAGAQENENRNGDLTFVYRPITQVPGATYFDDIMTWKTNTGVYSTFGNNSCAAP